MYHVQVLPKKFRSNGDIIGIYPLTQKLEVHTKQIAPCESTTEEVLFEW